MQNIRGSDPVPNTKKLIVSAQLLALDVVLTRLLAINTPLMKIGLGFAAVALCAILYGPWWAALVAALGDLVGALLFPTGAFFPGFTLVAVVGGLIYGKAVNGISSEEDVRKHPGDFIMLPQIGEEGRLKVMKGFLKAMAADAGTRIREEFGGAEDSLDVTVFENLLREEKLLIAWYKYRDDIYSELASRWCEANGLEMIR